MKNYFKHKMREKNPLAVVGMVLLIAIGIAALIALFGYVTMSLWNWLLPDLFGLKTITFWQAIGLVILAKIFFGGFGSDSSSKKSKKRKEYCKEEHKSKKDFSKWQLYDKFWKEEGEAAFNSFVDKSQNPSQSEEDQSEDS